jgi:hypothetical protein
MHALRRGANTDVIEAPRQLALEQTHGIAFISTTGARVGRVTSVIFATNLSSESRQTTTSSPITMAPKSLARLFDSK